MNISDENLHTLNSLIALAVKDAVLTPVERKTIVDKAVGYGLQVDEANAMLDNALRERIAQTPKTDLKSCPDCGAMVPLVSDFCPFCGHHYAVSESPQPENNVDSDEARIIEVENQRTEQQRVDNKTCDKCGHPYPLVSNVCPYCGNVLFHSDYHDLSAKKLADNIQSEIDNIQNMPRITVGMFIKYRITWLLMALGILSCIYLSDFHPGYAVVSFFVFMFAGLPFNRTKDLEKGAKGLIEEYNEKYYGFLGKIKLFENQIDNFYGDDAEARVLLDDLNKRVDAQDKAKTEVLRKAYLFVALILAVSIAAVCLLPRPAEYKPQTLSENVQKYPLDWQLFDSYKQVKLSPCLLEDGIASEYFEVDSQAVLSFNLHKDFGQEVLFDDDSDDRFCLLIKDLNIRYINSERFSRDNITFYIVCRDADGNNLAELCVMDWSPLYRIDSTDPEPVRMSFECRYTRNGENGQSQLQEILDLYHSIETYTLIFNKPQ